jgi:hypothetical protein
MDLLVIALISSPSCNQARNSIPSSLSPAVDTPRWAAACRSRTRAKSLSASVSAAERRSRTLPSSKRQLSDRSTSQQDVALGRLGPGVGEAAATPGSIATDLTTWIAARG